MCESIKGEAELTILKAMVLLDNLEKYVVVEVKEVLENVRYSKGRRVGRVYAKQQKKRMH